jgi:uncharacterized protein YpuA (DUF1002 family)
MRKKIWKKLACALAAASMITAAFTPMTAYADAERVVTLGANLSEAEQNAILKYFGVNTQNVNIIYVTNDEERALLSSYIPLEVIGSNTLSCAYVKPTNSGGIQVKTANLTWVTSNMIASALSTSGVRNCEVIAACPRPVSGTGALTGVLKAYEYASGYTLDPTKKQIAAQEITTTTDVADVVGQAEATQIVNDIKLQIIEDQVEEMDEARIQQIVDEAVAKTVQTIQAERDELVDLSNEQKQALNELAENIAAQKYQYEDVKDTLERVEQNVTVSPEINVNVNVNNENEATTGDTETTVQNDLPEDSILLNTDVTALGGDVITDATTEEAIQQNEEPAPEMTGDAPFEIQTSEEGSFGEDGSAAEPAVTEVVPTDEQPVTEEQPVVEEVNVFDDQPEVEEVNIYDDQPAAEDVVDIYDEQPADVQEVVDDTDVQAVPEADIDVEPVAEDVPADEAPADEVSAAPALAFDGSDRSFNGFSLKLYTDGDYVPASGSVVITQDGAEVKRIDLSETDAWGVLPDEDGSKASSLGFGEAYELHVFTSMYGGYAGSYHVTADIVFADADDSGKPIAGTEKGSAHAEGDLDFAPSGISVMDVNGDGFATPTTASIGLTVPEGTASVTLDSSDSSVAVPGEYDFDLGAAELVLDEPGTATISAAYYSAEGEQIGSDSLRIAGF